VFTLKGKFDELCIFLFLAVVFAPLILKPELAYDATLYHVASVKYYLEEDNFINLYKLTRLVQHGAFNFNSISQTLFSSLNGIQSATILSFFEMYLILQIVKTFVLNFSEKQKWTKYSYLLLLCVPMFSWLGAHGYADMFASLLLTGIAYVAYDILKNRTQRNLIVLSFLASISWFAKFNVAFFGVIILVFVLVDLYLEKPRKPIRLLLIPPLVYIVVLICYFFWTHRQTGNPFFPYNLTLFSTFSYNNEAIRLHNLFISEGPGNLSVMKVLSLPLSLLDSNSSVEGFVDPLSLILLSFGLYGFFIAWKITNRSSKIFLLVFMIWVIGVCLLMQTNLRYLVAVFPSILAILLVTLNNMERRYLNKVSILVLVGSTFSAALFSPILIQAFNNPVNQAKIGPLEYDYNYSIGSYEIEDSLLESFPAIKVLNRNVGKDDLTLDLTGVERLSLYVNARLFDASQWTSPLVNGQLSYLDKNLDKRLVALGIRFIVTDSAHIELLQSNPIIEHLELLDYSDGVTLYRILVRK
jgi:hypothetical protein